MKLEEIKKFLLSKKFLSVMSIIIVTVVGNFIYAGISNINFWKSLYKVFTLKIPLFVFLIIIILVILLLSLIRKKINKRQLWILAFGGMAPKDIPFDILSDKYRKTFFGKTNLDLRYDLDDLRKKELFRKSCETGDGRQLYRITSNGLRLLKRFDKKAEKHKKAFEKFERNINEENSEFRPTADNNVKLPKKYENSGRDEEIIFILKLVGNTPEGKMRDEDIKEKYFKKFTGKKFLEFNSLWKNYILRKGFLEQDKGITGYRGTEYYHITTEGYEYLKIWKNP